MLKLKSDRPSDICVDDMKDGNIAVITKWGNTDYIGRVVQRYNDSLICVGNYSGKGWGDYFNPSRKSIRNEKYCVRLLEPGEELVVE